MVRAASARRSPQMTPGAPPPATGAQKHRADAQQTPPHRTPAAVQKQAAVLLFPAHSGRSVR